MMMISVLIKTSTRCAVLYCSHCSARAEKMATAAATFESLASRHKHSLDELEEKHLGWTLESEMDEETLVENKPNILSPFLPSQVATMTTLLEFIPELDCGDCLIDIGLVVNTPYMSKYLKSFSNA